MKKDPNLLERNRLESSLWYCLATKHHAAKKNQRDAHTSDEQSEPHLPIPSGLVKANRHWHEREGKENQRVPDSRSNKVIAIGTVILGIVGIGSLWLTSRSNRLTKEATNNAAKAFRVDERAWIGMTDIKPDYLSNYAPSEQFPFVIIPVQVQAKYTNFGKTPAQNVNAVLRLRAGEPIPPTSSGTVRVIGPVLPECANDKKRMTDIQGPTDFPNSTHGTLVHPDSEVAPYAGDIAHSEKGLYLTGCIDYDDIFGQWHRTHVCRYWSIETLGALIDCSTGNQAS